MGAIDSPPSVDGPPVDSREGIAILMRWAAAHGFVLNKCHRDIAAKYEVSTEGVRFADLLVGL